MNAGAETAMIECVIEIWGNVKPGITAKQSARSARHIGQGQTPDAKSVQTFVEGFLLRLGDHQYDTLDADFTPNALIVVTRQRGNQWENSYQSAVAWLAGLIR